MGSPQKNKLAIFCFPCVVTGNSLSKEKKIFWGGGVLLRLLFANSLCSQDRGKWLRKLKFIEIYFSGEVGCVSWRVKPCTVIFGQWGRELFLWLCSEGGMCRFVEGGNLPLVELVIMSRYRPSSSPSCLKSHCDSYSYGHVARRSSHWLTNWLENGALAQNVRVKNGEDFILDFKFDVASTFNGISGRNSL